VFFQRYATMSVASQQYLATALLPSARTAAALDQAMRRKTVASGAIAPQVIKFAIQLLQMHVLDRDGNRELFGHEPLAEIVMGEIIACGANPLVSKVYLNAICKVPAALPTYDAGTETSETVARIHAYALHAASMFSSEEHANSVCLKEVESIKKTYRWPGDAEDLPTRSRSRRWSSTCWITWRNSAPGSRSRLRAAPAPMPVAAMTTTLTRMLAPPRRRPASGDSRRDEPGPRSPIWES
jgi:hypothetical protein